MPQPDKMNDDEILERYWDYRALFVNKTDIEVRTLTLNWALREHAARYRYTPSSKFMDAYRLVLGIPQKRMILCNGVVKRAGISTDPTVPVTNRRSLRNVTPPHPGRSLTPLVCSVFLFAVGGVGLFSWGLVLMTNQALQASYPTLGLTLCVCGALGMIFSVFAIIGGLFSLIMNTWTISMLGAVMEFLYWAHISSLQFCLPLFSSFCLSTEMNSIDMFVSL